MTPHSTLYPILQHLYVSYLCQGPCLTFIGQRIHLNFTSVQNAHPHSHWVSEHDEKMTHEPWPSRLSHFSPTFPPPQLRMSTVMRNKKMMYAMGIPKGAEHRPVTGASAHYFFLQGNFLDCLWVLLRCRQCPNLQMYCLFLAMHSVWEERPDQ